MSDATPAPSDAPLTQLVLELNAWVETLGRFGLRRRGEGPDDPDCLVRASDELEQFREPAKAIIVWLELRGRDADAAEADDAIAGLRETVQQYDAGELQPLFSEQSDEPFDPLDQLIESASRAAGRLEDLDGLIPASVWQGFGDA